MRYADTPRGRAAFEDSGGEGPPVLLSHDDGRDRTMFAPQVTELSDVYRVVTWDRGAVGDAHPGMVGGRTSDTPDRGSAPTQEAGDPFALLDAIGVERAVLGGVGSGAEVAVRAALRQPDRVRALVLIEPPDFAAAGHELVERLEELAMPVLLVSGGEIAEHGTALRQIADRVEDCRGVVELEDAPAPVNQSRAGDVNDALRSFLESLPA